VRARLIWLSALFSFGALVFFSSPPGPTTRDHFAAKLTVATGHGTAVYIGNNRFLTAAHVVEDDRDNPMTLTTSDGITFAVTVIGYDDNTELAILSSTTPADPHGMKAATLPCDRPDPGVGAALEIVGYPLKFSSVHFYGRVAGRADHPGVAGLNVIVGDITAAPGASGAPVLDSTGALVGLVSAVSSWGTPPAILPITFIIPRSAI
jgi:putative serine protease PepD